MRGGGKCARRVLCSPERESGRREEAGGGGGSLFSLPPFVCPPVAAGVVSGTFARCLTIDGSLIFARGTLAVSSVAPSVVNPRKRGREREREREIHLSHWLNLAVNVYHNKKRVFACGYYRFHGCKNRCVRSGKYREVYKRLRTLIMKV